MHKKPLLLCLSSNAELLELRRRVLGTRYDVTAIATLEQTEALPSDGAFNLLLLCHSL